MPFETGFVKHFRIIKLPSSKYVLFMVSTLYNKNSRKFLSVQMFIF